jgi:hypothetical protein
MEDASNGGNRGPVVNWYEDILGRWDIRGNRNEDESHEGLELKGRDYITQTHMMDIVCLIEPEFGQRVVKENRIFTDGEIAVVLDDLAYGISRKANDILGLRKWCELELINVGEPSRIIIDKCRAISDLAVKHSKSFYKLANQRDLIHHHWPYDGKYFWTLVLSDTLEKFDRLMHFCDVDLIEITEDDFHEYQSMPDDEERLRSIPPKQALGDALKLLDYIQAVFNERSKSIDESQPAPDLAKEKRLDAGVVKIAEMSKPRLVLVDEEYMVLVALLLLKQSINRSDVRNRANELGGNFTNGSITTICSNLKKKFLTDTDYKKTLRITELGERFVRSDVRWTSYQHHE